MLSFPFMLSAVNGFPLELSSGLSRQTSSLGAGAVRSRPISTARGHRAHAGALPAHHISRADVSGLSCRAQLRSARLVWQTLETCSTLCTTSEFT